MIRFGLGTSQHFLNSCYRINHSLQLSRSIRALKRFVEWEMSDSGVDRYEVGRFVPQIVVKTETVKYFLRMELRGSHYI